jgi:hypothetical protein
MTQAGVIADVLAELRGQLSGQTYHWPADQEEIVKAAMARLKDIPPEAAVEFTLTSLRIVRDEHQGWPGHVLNKILGNVLRRNLTFTEDQVVEMIELASLPHREFPYRGILKAAESMAETPRVAEALRVLRPCITEFLGGSEARDLHARIDILLNGPAPNTSLEVQGAWSQKVFQEISTSSHRSAWERIFCHASELKSSEAPKKWRATARQLVDELGKDIYLEAAIRWLEIGPSPDRPVVQISSGEAELQKGFVWFLATRPMSVLPPCSPISLLRR